MICCKRATLLWREQPSSWVTQRIEMVVMSECCRLPDSGHNRAHHSMGSWLLFAKNTFTCYSIFFLNFSAIISLTPNTHTVFEGRGSWLRMRGLFSISKLPLSFFSPCSLLPLSYILCWREQSGLIISIWFEMNREDSKGKTTAGGNDGSVCSLYAKRINTNLESMLLHCVWSQSLQPLCFALPWPSALSSLTRLRWDVPVRCCVIPSFSQQWWNTLCTVSHWEYLPAHISITQCTLLLIAQAPFCLWETCRFSFLHSYPAVLRTHMSC